MKQQPRFGAVGWISEAHPPSLPSRWMRFAYPPYAGTFFICWGDETLNMIVKYRSVDRYPDVWKKLKKF
uniref:Uncharacterized protein n=1 Tax=Candidatus Kentrum sp. LPFa TaxID=2126335 RepID=A0A450WK42_9GAMM|nr:MAG: hypothetical protein BECKLPF1236B_GA0070989_111610 [Candidatus Kentron sp. LPFa]